MRGRAGVRRLRLPGLALIAAIAAAPAAGAVEPNVAYALHCTGCHTTEGVSPPLGRIPPLRDVVGYYAAIPEGRRYMANVPGVLAAGLSDADTAALFNWLVEVFAGRSMPAAFSRFDAAELRALRAVRPDDPMALREAARQALARRGIAIAPYP
jgi:mono/diheme cytochrome c family protein